MRLPHLFAAILGISLQRELAHRTNLVFEGLVAGTSAAAGIAALGIVFAHVRTLAGWTLPEALALLGAFTLITGLLQTFVEPNLEWFAGKVKSGEVDDLLLQPVPSLFTASLGTCRPWSLTGVLVGAAMIVLGALQMIDRITPAGVVSCLLLLIVGTAIAWSYRLLFATLAFWAPGVEPTVLSSPLWQLGRYPVQIYRRPLRWAVTYAVPAAFIGAVPARALSHGLDLPLILQSGGFAFVAVWLVSRVWNAGLRRYTSATS